MPSPVAPAVAVLLALVLPAAAGASTEVDAFIREEMARQKVPGVSLAVVRGGRPWKVAGYGLANVEHAVPVAPHTLFQSGSLGKQFTAALVLSLVEEGRLSLDESIAAYLPATPEPLRPITVRHLLTHTSGLPEYTEGAVDLRRDYTEDELVSLALRLVPEFTPGSRWSYSNTGYVLLGALVRRVAGRFYGDLLRERVFEPLGMKTARVISEADIVPHRAAGYRLVGGELKNQDWVAPSLNTTADGALYFSALDLLAWDQAVRARGLLKPESWALALEPVRLRSGRRYPYGFGWQIDEVAGRPVHAHGGSWQGFRSYLIRYGDTLTVAVLTNLAQASPERMAKGVAALVDPALAPSPRRPPAEPSVSARLRALLSEARAGRLSAEQFAYVPAGFFPGTASRYRELLGRLGEPVSLELRERRELGDDVVYDYEVAYPGHALRVTLGVAPDQRLSALEIRPSAP